MKTKEELNALKEEVETVNKERHAMSDGELEQVSGGDGGNFGLYCSNPECMAHTVSFCAATPGTTCPVCNAGIIQKIFI